MKKKMFVWVVLCAFMSFNLAPSIYAQTTITGPSGASSATVVPVLEFSLRTVKKMSVAAGDTNPFTQGQDVSASPSFNFGSLTKVFDTTVGSPTFGQFLFMQGQFFYYVLMIASTSGRRYQITETGSLLTGASSGVPLPLNSVVLVPDYNSADQLGGVAQGLPPGAAFVGQPTTACATNSVVYQSDAGGLGRLVRGILAIGGPQAGATKPFNFSQGFDGSGVGHGSRQEFTNWTPIGPDQRADTYQGTITFTLALD